MGALVACCCSVDPGLSCLTLLLLVSWLPTPFPPLQLWAFSRDNLMPGSKYMRRLDKISQTPAVASECCSEGILCFTGNEICTPFLFVRSVLTTTRLCASWGVPFTCLLNVLG